MIPLVAKTRIGGMSAGASSALEKGQVLAEKGKKNDKTGSGNRTTMASADIEVLRLKWLSSISSEWRRGRGAGPTGR